jgi:hypothetical protein
VEKIPLGLKFSGFRGIFLSAAASQTLWKEIRLG